MTRMQRIIEAERRVAARRFSMRGVVTKKNFFSIARSFGVRKALRVLLSTEATALSILMA